MAESNRSSGRRAPLASGGSGRRQPVEPPAEEPVPLPAEEPVAPQEHPPAPRLPRSSRRAALPPEAAAPIESLEVQPQDMTATARMAAQVPTASSRTTRRTAAPGASSVKKKVRGVGKELMICFGVIAVLAVAAIIIFVVQSSRNRDITAKMREEAEKFERNMKLGFDSYQRAENAGLLFVLGKDDQATDDKLFGSFRRDDKIYNVILDRTYKDRRNQTKTEQKSMSRERLKIASIEPLIGREENGVSVNYALAEDKTRPIVIAKKVIKAPQGDSANLGGIITVIAKAESDHRFENAKKPRAAPAPAPEKEKTEKKE